MSVGRPSDPYSSYNISLSVIFSLISCRPFLFHSVRLCLRLSFLTISLCVAIKDAVMTVTTFSVIRGVVMPVRSLSLSKYTDR